MRRERAFYWEYRVRPATDPLVYLSYIQDGASQEVYHIPKFPNTESGRDGVQFKLVGNLWHGTDFKSNFPKNSAARFAQMEKRDKKEKFAKLGIMF